MMQPDWSDNLPLEQRLALAHTGRKLRPAFEAFLALDGRLAHFVSHSSETMLTQMRIAWWRDQFAKETEDRPNGDPVLDRLSAHWRGEENALIALVDGWEALLAEPPLPSTAAMEFVDGRAACFAALARLGDNQPAESAAFALGQRWALGDLIARISDAEEIRIVLEQASNLAQNTRRMPHALRSMSILGRLGQQAIDDGGGPLLSRRNEMLLVMRLGLLGR